MRPSKKNSKKPSKKEKGKETGYIKYITEEEFKLILKEANLRKSEPFLICLKFMAYLGLRVSDATQLQTSNLNPDYNELTYKDRKTGIIQTKEIPPFFQEEIKKYIAKYHALFREGYLFPPRTNHHQHIRSCTFRHFFKDFRRKYGLDQPYYIRKDNAPLYRISVHTLKHYCLYKVYKASGNDISFTQTFSGHKEMKHTIRYIMTQENRHKQAAVLERAFANTNTSF